MIQYSKKINMVSFFSFYIEAEHKNIFMMINVNKEVVENDLKHITEMLTTIYATSFMLPNLSHLIYAISFMPPHLCHLIYHSKT